MLKLKISQIILCKYSIHFVASIPSVAAVSRMAPSATVEFILLSSFLELFVEPCSELGLLRSFGPFYRFCCSTDVVRVFNYIGSDGFPDSIPFL